MDFFGDFGLQHKSISFTRCSHGTIVICTSAYCDKCCILSQIPANLTQTASGVFRIWQRGRPWRARRARAYNGGLGAEPPAGSRGRAPGRGVRPPEAETLCFFNVQWKRQIRYFFLKFAGKRQKTHLFI